MPTRPDSRGLLAPVLLVLLGLGMAVFLLWLLGQRVGTGDVYPEYSSLRADPLGTKALYLAIDGMPDKQAERNLRAWRRVDLDTPTTVLCLGSGLRAMRGELPYKDRVALLGWLHQGHRVVLTLPPASSWEDRADRRARERKEKKAREEKEQSGKEKKDGPAAEKEDDISAKDSGKDQDPLLKETGFFGLGYAIAAAAKDAGEADREFVSSTYPEVNWRGSFTLKIPEGSPDWITEATVAGKPVIASRRIGAGELVVCADTTFASNQGVWQDRASPFLLALIGAHPHVLFDERLLGTGEDPGLMTLIRQLRLHGLLVGGALVLLLLVWQGLCPLVPVDPEKDMGLEEDGSTAGRDTADGLVALLQRGLPPDRVLADGLDRWLSSRERGPSPAPDALDRARGIATHARPGHLAAAYLAIRNLLHRTNPRPRNHHGSP